MNTFLSRKLVLLMRNMKRMNGNGDVVNHLETATELKKDSSRAAQLKKYFFELFYILE